MCSPRVSNGYDRLSIFNFTSLGDNRVLNLFEGMIVSSQRTFTAIPPNIPHNSHHTPHTSLKMPRQSYLVHGTKINARVRREYPKIDFQSVLDRIESGLVVACVQVEGMGETRAQRLADYDIYYIHDLYDKCFNDECM